MLSLTFCFKSHYFLLCLPRRVSELAGDFSLAEAAAENLHAVFLLEVADIIVHIAAAFYLVVTLFRNGTGGAAGNAGPAFLIYIK